VASLRPVSGTAAEILALLREWDAADDPAPLSVETSGSTGTPKRVLLSRAAMRTSADATHARLGGVGQWLLNLPPAYVAGLQVLFRSVRAGTDPVVQDGSFEDAAAAMTGARRYVSLVPTPWCGSSTAMPCPASTPCWSVGHGSTRRCGRVPSTRGSGWSRRTG